MSAEEGNSSSTNYSSGVANLPNQIHYLASTRAALQLNILLFGDAALGKTQMINSILGVTGLFNQQQAQATIGNLRLRQRELDERGFRVNLRLVDIPELGQALRKQHISEEVLQYVREQHLRHLQAETATTRSVIEDSRVHVCLYFLNPNNHKLSDLDLGLLARLSKLTNVILIIAKADMLLRHELHRIKYNVRDQLRATGITLFRMPEQIEAEPFVCLNADDLVNAGTGGRTYPWGFVRRTQSNAKLNISSGVNELSAVLFRSYLPLLLQESDNFYEGVREEFLVKNGQGSSPEEKLLAVRERLAQLSLKAQ